MPFAPPRLCACGDVVPYGVRCKCQRERKARADARRPSARARGYTREWDVERAAYLAQHPTCCRCPRPATVVDHIMAHKGNMRLFWNRANWQPLCAPCHNGAKQSEERRGARP